jgi:signal transduction histidine kinase
VRVSDQGSGIPKDELPFVFDRFFRGKSTESRGTGIGLALAKAVIETHGGTVSVSSTPGKGSSFLVLLERGLGTSKPDQRGPLRS